MPYLQTCRDCNTTYDRDMEQCPTCRDAYKPSAAALDIFDVLEKNKLKANEDEVLRVATSLLANRMTSWFIVDCLGKEEHNKIIIDECVIAAKKLIEKVRGNK